MCHAPTVNQARDAAIADLKAGTLKPSYSLKDVDNGFARFLWDTTRIAWGRLSLGFGGNMGGIGSFSGTLTVTKKRPVTMEMRALVGACYYEFRYEAFNRTSRKSGGGHGPANRPVDQFWDFYEDYSEFGKLVVGPDQ
jgi:hypothetical protein